MLAVVAGALVSKTHTQVKEQVALAVVVLAGLARQVFRE
jgi:hypothetical protein